MEKREIPFTIRVIDGKKEVIMCKNPNKCSMDCLNCIWTQDFKHFKELYQNTK